MQGTSSSNYELNSFGSLICYLIFRVWVWIGAIISLIGLLYIPNHFLNREEIVILSIENLEPERKDWAKCEITYKPSSKGNLSMKFNPRKEDTFNLPVGKFTEIKEGTLDSKVYRNRLFGYYYGLDKFLGYFIPALIVSVVLIILGFFVTCGTTEDFIRHREKDNIGFGKILGLNVSNRYLKHIRKRLKDIGEYGYLYDWYVFEYNWIKFWRLFIPTKKEE